MSFWLDFNHFSMIKIWSEPNEWSIWTPAISINTICWLGITNYDPRQMSQHIPILIEAVLATLRPEDPMVNRLIDGTVGGGGHSRAFLDAGIEDVLACDRDANAIDHARKRLASYGDRVKFFHGSYVDLQQAALGLGWEAADAILLDLGLSSLQLDDPERGFSFRHDAPLDMRFYTGGDSETAYDLVNSLPADELADLLFRYGDERYSRRISRAIERQRPIASTRKLAEVVSSVIPAQAKRSSKIHPATKVFQALRIAVNQELNAVKQVLPIAVDFLRPGGRLAIITFHSLEDRLVKHYFKQLSTNVVSPPGMGSIEERRARIKLVNRKPIVPDRAEVSANPRSRSAKLRVVEKLQAT